MADKAEDSTEQASDAPDSNDADVEGTGWLHRFMSSTLRISSIPPEKLLPEISIEGVAKYILSSCCKNVVTVAGKGISTSSGFPDHHTEESGLYKDIYKYTSCLTTANDIFSIDYFRKTPRPFFILAKELLPGNFKPTPSHYFIKMLHDKGKLLRHYTQNIDTLERVCGLEGDKIVEAYGGFHTSHCQTCGKEFSEDWIKEQILSDVIPRCDKLECHGVVKPDIVFFGEELTKRFTKCVNVDMAKCDMLIVMGTSLVGQPFSSITSRVPATTPRLYINLDKGRTGMDPFAALLLGGGGFNFDGKDNYRDVFMEATCDDGCYALADLLGWGAELKEIAKKHEKIDKEITKTKETSKAKQNIVSETACKGTSKPECEGTSKKKSHPKSGNSRSKLANKEASKPVDKTAFKAEGKTGSKIKIPSIPKSSSELKGNTVSKPEFKEASKTRGQDGISSKRSKSKKCL